MSTARDAEAVVAFWRLVFPEYDDPSRPQRDPRASVERKLAFRYPGDRIRVQGHTGSTGSQAHNEEFSLRRRRPSATCWRVRA